MAIEQYLENWLKPERLLQSERDLASQWVYVYESYIRSRLIKDPIRVGIKSKIVSMVARYWCCEIAELLLRWTVLRVYSIWTGIEHFKH